MPIKKVTTKACIETHNQCLYSNSEPTPTQKVKSKTYKGIHSQCLYRNLQCQYRNIQLISKWKLITNTYTRNHSNPLYRNSPRPIQEITTMPIQEFTDIAHLNVNLVVCLERTMQAKQHFSPERNAHTCDKA